MTYTKNEIINILSDEDFDIISNYDEIIEIDSEFYGEYTIAKKATYNILHDNYEIYVEADDIDEKFDSFDEAEAYIDEMLNEWERENIARDIEYWHSR